MSGPPPTVGRCPRCGTFVPAATSPWGYSTVHPCPRCGQPIVIVPPRDPPPLYTWEVYPNLYGSAPLPRGNPYHWRPAIAALLWVAFALLAGSAAALVVVSGVTLAAGPVTVAGTVEETFAGGIAPAPLAGAQVRLTGDAGAVRLAITDADGRFAFPGVATGGIGLNVTYPGLTPAALALFDSPFYSSPNLRSLAIDLGSGPNASTSAAESDFADLEAFVSSVATAALLLALGAVAALFGAIAAAAPRFGPGIPAAGVGAAVAPAALLLLGVVEPFPALVVPSVAAVVIGGTAAGAAVTRRWLIGPFEGDADGPASP